MPNETLIAIPMNVAEPDNLIRFLRSLIEELDLILGLRGNDPYVKESQLTTATDTGSITSNVAAIIAALEIVEETLDVLQTQIDETDSNVDINTDDIATLLEHVDLSSAYHDFDANEYETLQGHGYFSTLGSDITNAPYTPVGGETYYNFIQAVTTSGGGVMHELKAYSTTTLVPTSYFRIGDTWTNAKALGWT